MNNHGFYSWRAILLAMAITMLAAPMAMAVATPPNAPTNPLYPTGIAWNPKVDYTKANFAYSPNIRKFVDALPGVGAPGCTPNFGAGNCNENDLNQYIPLAAADTATFAGNLANPDTANPASDFYSLEVGQYTQKMHSDLPPATLRGYAEYNSTATGAHNGVLQYLGPLIIAHTYDPTKKAGVNGNGKPVRFMVHNLLPTGVAGNLPLPVDPTYMGAGPGPNGAGAGDYSQNRVTMHLHGGATPWISDGTPSQWFTPAAEPSVYSKGASFVNVPDMITGSCNATLAAGCFTPAAFTYPATGGHDGIGTDYYTNQQSARLMFYHDHAYGITRLNVYDGMAAGYLLVDQYEEDMISGTNVAGANPANAQILPNLGGVYKYGIPLVFEDKTFVNDATAGANVAGSPAATAWTALPNNPATGAPYVKTSATLTTDPLWGYYTPTPGNLTGITGMPGGSLWFPHEYLPIENPRDPSGNTWNGRWDYAGFVIPPANPLNLTLPSPTGIPEAFGDTATVNGTAFPYLTLPPDAVRFRILSVGNDRSLNLSIFYAVDKNGVVCKYPNNFDAASCTEPKMVTAAPNTTFPLWPRDGRDGGVPDPTTSGPPWIQIGNEGGVMAQVALFPAQPVDFIYNRQTIPLLGVSSHSLLLMPAMRADVIADFSSAHAGDVLLVYNDAPAPMPNGWPFNDNYTDDVDQTSVGGAHTTPRGFGPNTRTYMQIRIAGSKTSTLDYSATIDPKTGVLTNPGPTLAALMTTLPQVFAASQPSIIVPQLAYNNAYPVGNPHHFNGATDNYVQGYQTTVNITGQGQPIAKIRTTPGAGYLVAPTIKIIDNFPASCYNGAGTLIAPCAKAIATPGLNPMGPATLTTAGLGYTAPPSITITNTDPTTLAALAPPPTFTATATTTVSGGQVTSINIDEPGAGYSDPVNVPTCTIAPPNDPACQPFTVNTATCIQALCTVQLATLNTVGSVTFSNNGAGYIAQPETYITSAAGDLGQGATAVAMLNGDLAQTGKALTEGFDPTYGRVFVQLGSVPNALTPSVGAGFVVGLAYYIDPPTEIINDGEPIIWRITHLGVDSHAMHFHLFNLQVINHVDYTNVIKPPYPDEIGWREVIRTNPMEDIIVAIRPMSPVLPFVVPVSMRLLDPTMPAGPDVNFVPVAPPVGIGTVPQITNVVTNFGWEYVWHCHILGHEENDMMRPMVFLTATSLPLAPTLSSATPSTGKITLIWAANAGTTTDNAPTGYYVQRAPNNNTYTTIATINDKNVVTYVDTSITTGAIYNYRIVAFNSISVKTGSLAAVSNVINVTATTFTAPTVNITAPTTGTDYIIPASILLQATATTPGGSSVTLVEYYSGGTLIGSSSTGSTNYSFNWTGVNAGTYSLTAKVYNSLGATAVSGVVTVTVGLLPAAPAIVSPSGAGIATTTAFTFNAVLGATGYQIYLNDYNTGIGGPINITPAQAGCSVGTTCSYTPATPLTPNSYGWEVAAQNASGQGPWSTILNFTVALPPLPAAPAIVSPSGAGIATTTALTFNAVSGATGYQIYLYDYTTGIGGPIDITPAQAGCSVGTTCSYTPATALTSTNGYGWEVAAKNPSGQGPWSTILNFVVQ